MSRDIKSEIEDILSLSRSVNTDIQESNRRSIDQNATLKVNIVNPKAAIETLIKTSGQNLSPADVARVVNPRPAAIASFDGQPVEVSAPMGLIPLPDGYTMPPPSIAPSTPPPTTAQIPTTISIPTVTPDAIQLELGLAFEHSKNRPIIDEIYLKFKRLEDKLDILNAKMNELLSIERKKYERRIKKSTEGLG